MILITKKLGGILMKKCDLYLVRIIDIIFSLIAIAATLPIMIVVILILNFTGEGKVIYRQKRVGRNGKQFNIIKFATMLENSPNMSGGAITVSGDPRILPFGGFLRKTKINELPQLINVMKGEMSLIGPRPMTPNIFYLYSDVMQILITSVQPGLSGLGSIVFRNEEKLLSSVVDPKILYKEVISPYKASLEKWYIENRSFSLYASLLLVTIAIVLVPSVKLRMSIFKGMPKIPFELKIIGLQNIFLD
jgi:lipopolysaccharide/colanic/teichoic acid biosynthesis glycosyltransferase